MGVFRIVQKKGAAKGAAIKCSIKNNKARKKSGRQKWEQRTRGTYKKQ